MWLSVELGGKERVVRWLFSQYKTPPGFRGGSDLQNTHYYCR